MSKQTLMNSSEDSDKISLFKSLSESPFIHCIPSFVPYPFQKEVWNKAARAVLSDRCGCEDKSTCPECSKACRRFVLVWHRRSGKDFLCWQFAVWTAIGSKKPCQIFYCLPTFSQCRRVIMESKDLEGKSFLSIIPESLISRVNSQDLTIHLKNGSNISLISSNSYDKIRGSNASLFILSEFAFYSGQAQKEILTAVLPILERNKGILIINSTPNSRNYFYEVFTKASASDDWHTSLVSIKDSQLMSEESVQGIINSGIMSDAKAKQEFYCDFAISESTIYSSEMAEARATNRIGKVFPDQFANLCCAFDLGWSDSTFVVVYEYDDVTKTIKIFDEIEDTGKPISWYMEQLRGKSYSRRISDIFLPRDSKKHDLSNGLSIYKVVRDISERWNWHFRTHIVDSNQPLHLQVDFCRTHFSKVLINEDTCPRLLICLDNYSMVYDEKNNVFTKPKHDQYSHGASAFSYALMSIRFLGRRIDKNQDNELFNRYRPII